MIVVDARTGDVLREGSVIRGFPDQNGAGDRLVMRIEVGLFRGRIHKALFLFLLFAPESMEIVFDDPIVVQIHSLKSCFHLHSGRALGERDYGMGVTDFLVQIVGQNGPVRLGFSRAELVGKLP